MNLRRKITNAFNRYFKHLLNEAKSDMNEDTKELYRNLQMLRKHPVKVDGFVLIMKVSHSETMMCCSGTQELLEEMLAKAEEKITKVNLEIN